MDKKIAVLIALIILFVLNLSTIYIILNQVIDDNYVVSQVILFVIISIVFILVPVIMLGRILVKPDNKKRLIAYAKCTGMIGLLLLIIVVLIPHLIQTEILGLYKVLGCNLDNPCCSTELTHPKYTSITPQCQSGQNCVTSLKTTLCTVKDINYYSAIKLAAVSFFVFSMIAFLISKNSRSE